MRPEEGRPEPLGVQLSAAGANVAVWSAHAAQIELCLFDAADRETRIPLPGRTGPVHHGFVRGLRPGTRYGLRAHGPGDPAAGHRFDPAKLLIDPWAREWDGGFGPAGPALAPGADSAAVVPKGVMTAEPPPVDPAERPRIPWTETVICEAHVRSLTRLWPGLDPALAGTFDALGHPEVIAHLRAQGITTLELLPVQARADEVRLQRLGLANHWGYSTLGFLAPEPRLCGPAGPAGLREAVRRLHAAGIEVILDIALNHSGEEDETGPTYAFRGLDNAAWYRLGAGGAYENPTGCGNMLDMARMPGLRLAMDALRHWVTAFGVDGFRFDLATTLGRTRAGFDPDAPLFLAIAQDPVLRDAKLVAEPWDLGPGGYRLGGFPPAFREWNDRFRDTARRFWRGDPVARDLADALLGSARVFDRDRRPATASVNYVAAHDGFTLADLASYRRKRNEANGEGNRDGHDENWSDNCGAEGPSADPAIVARRAARMRALLATVLVAQGVPMLRAGDEIGQSQGGNNNAYAQDNATSWIDWARDDPVLRRFAARLAAFRRAHPALRQPRFLHGAAGPDGRPDVEWHAPAGGPVAWEDPALAALLLVIRAEGDEVCLALNSGPATLPLALPPLPAGRTWRLALDTGDPARSGPPPAALAPGTLLALAAEAAP